MVEKASIASGCSEEKEKKQNLGRFFSFFSRKKEQIFARKKT
jgi:hypothetical protein